MSAERAERTWLLRFCSCVQEDDEEWGNQGLAFFDDETVRGDCSRYAECAAADALEAKAQERDRLVAALRNVSYESDFGNGMELCWCREGFHDSMPDDSEPDFHSSTCQDARAALLTAEAGS